MRQSPEHRSVQANQNHHLETLIRVRRAKGRGRYKNASGNALGEGHELPLQVAAKNRLLANTGRDREGQPQGYFDATMRQNKLHISTPRVYAQKPGDDKKETYRDQPECRGNSDVPHDLAGGAPSLSPNDEKPHTAAPDTRPPTKQ